MCGGIVTHACLRFSQTEKLGAGNGPAPACEAVTDRDTSRQRIGRSSPCRVRFSIDAVVRALRLVAKGYALRIAGLPVPRKGPWIAAQ